MDIKDQISLAPIQVVHGAQSGGRSCGDETTHGRVVGAWEQNHLGRGAGVADRINRPLHCCSPVVDVKVVRL